MDRYDVVCPPADGAAVNPKSLKRFNMPAQKMGTKEALTREAAAAATTKIEPSLPPLPPIPDEIHDGKEHPETSSSQAVKPPAPLRNDDVDLDSNSASNASKKKGKKKSSREVRSKEPKKSKRSKRKGGKMTKTPTTERSTGSSTPGNMENGEEPKRERTCCSPLCIIISVIASLLVATGIVILTLVAAHQWMGATAIQAFRF